MTRILFFVFIAFLVWLLVRVMSGKRRQEDVNVASQPVQSTPQSITQCAWCGVHVPAGDAVSLPDGRLYCGDPHRQAALAVETDRAPS